MGVLGKQVLGIKAQSMTTRMTNLCLGAGFNVWIKVRFHVGTRLRTL